MHTEMSKTDIEEKARKHPAILTPDQRLADSKIRLASKTPSKVDHRNNLVTLAREGLAKTQELQILFKSIIEAIDDIP